MQKKIVAIAATLVCAGALPVWAQTASPSKVELWGIVDAAVRHTNNEGASKGGLTKMLGGGMSQSRWGIKVEEDLGGGTKALVELENRFNADDGSVSTPFFQLAYVGLQGPYGRLTMGRQWNVLFDVVTSTYASFPYSPYMEAYKPELGMAAGARSSNALKYTLATPDRKWVGTLQYSFKEGNTTTNVDNAVVTLGDLALGAPGASAAASAATGNAVLAGLGGGVPAPLQPAYTDLVNQINATAGGAYKTAGGFLRFSQNGISVGAGFLRTYLPGGSDLDAWTLGGSYRKNKLYVNIGYGLNKLKTPKVNPASAADVFKSYARDLVDRGIVNSMWQGQTNGGFQVGDSDKRQMVKVGFGYQLTPQINAGMHYFRAKQSGSVSGASNGTSNMMVAAVDYAFSKRTDAYVAIDRTTVSGGQAVFIDLASQTRNRTGFTVGLRHRF